MIKPFCTLTSWSIFWRALLQQVLLRLKRISFLRSFPRLLPLEASIKKFKSSHLNLKALLPLPHPTECKGFHKDPESSILVAGHQAISIPSLITGQFFVPHFLLQPVSILLSSLPQKCSCGFLLQNYQEPNKILVPHIKQEATLWQTFENEMTLLQFPKSGLRDVPSQDERFMNPTRILCCLKMSNASTSTQRNCPSSCSSQYLDHGEDRLANRMWFCNTTGIIFQCSVGGKNS